MRAKTVFLCAHPAPSAAGCHKPRRPIYWRLIEMSKITGSLAARSGDCTEM